VASDLRGIDRNTLGDVTNSIAVNPLYVDRGGRASWCRPSRLSNRLAPWIGNEMSINHSVGATPRICWPIPPTDGAAADAGLDSAFRRRGRTSRKECACSNGQCGPIRTRRRQPCLRWLSRRLLRHPRPFRTRRHCAPAPACRVGSWAAERFGTGCQLAGNLSPPRREVIVNVEIDASKLHHMCVADETPEDRRPPTYAARCALIHSMKSAP
jgi:hypothetical protein